MEWIVILAVVGLIGLWMALAYNGMISGRNQIRNAWAQIDVQLRRRHDLIPNLVEVVKDSMAYDRETLEAVIRARNAAVSASGSASAAGLTAGVAQAEEALGGAVGRLFAVMEAYPTLKSQENVASLMEELSSTENRIAFARQHYNDSVMAQNNRIQTFPNVMVAGSLGFREEMPFEASVAERAPIMVDLK
jgi:LemA protein